MTPSPQQALLGSYFLMGPSPFYLEDPWTLPGQLCQDKQGLFNTLG